MTDRYYPSGLPSESGVWKTTYEELNEMRSYARSEFPPGYAGFQPGTRDKFGYSTPGPDLSRLPIGKSQFLLGDPRESPAIIEPRRNQAIPRVPAPHDRETFDEFDLPEMERSGTIHFAQDSQRALPRVRSLPTLERKPAPPPLRQPTTPLEEIQDASYTYFVPKSMSHFKREKVNSSRPFLSRLQKEDLAVASLEGSGTGFKSQCPLVGWYPAEQRFPGPAPVLDDYTSYKAQFGRPPFYRMSPIGMRKGSSLGSTL